MSPDPVIKSILIRYENNLPVSTEEKAVLHKWLGNAVKFYYGWKSPVWPKAKLPPFSKGENAPKHLKLFTEAESLFSPFEKGGLYMLHRNKDCRGIYRIRNLLQLFFGFLLHAFQQKNNYHN